ncbi:MAG: CtsR family transcriptional regulator [Oscillospiraceae bacterium]|nr:CtsR family transcriptional regulator [Oscillospiraceae bacterium]
MRISDSIEKFILELLKDEESWLELNRREIADIFRCVPSNINYVIETRFSPERGFAVESRRGGGGYIRIRRIAPGDDVIQILNNVGEETDCGRAEAIIKYLADTGRITEREMRLFLAAVSERSLHGAQKDHLRASVLKNMITAIQE